MFKELYYLCFGPRIYGKFDNDNYEMNVIEWTGENFIKVYRGIRKCAITLFPLTFYWYFKHTEGFTNFTPIINQFCIVCIFYGLRTIGRALK